MADALTLASMAANLVQLLAIFKQERGEKAASDHREFTEWLAYHRHESLKQYIANNAAVRDGVDRLLREDHKHIMAKLDRVNEVLISLVSNIEEFKGLTSAINPQVDFSEQAISILRQMVATHTEIEVGRDGNDFTLCHVTTETPPIEYNDSKFLANDMEALEAAGLLSIVDVDQWNARYRITRAAVKFVKALDAPKQQ